MIHVASFVRKKLVSGFRFNLEISTIRNEQLVTSDSKPEMLERDTLHKECPRWISRHTTMNHAGYWQSVGQKNRIYSPTANPSSTAPKSNH
jgi:hypothetical protein